MENATTIWKRIISNVIDLFLFTLLFTTLMSILQEEKARAWAGGCGEAVAAYIAGPLSLYFKYIKEDNTRYIDLTQIIVLFFLITYMIVQEIFFGRTAGKFITGIKVVNKQGKKPNSILIILREFLKMLPFVRISLLARKSQGIHNIITNLSIVDTDSLMTFLKTWKANKYKENDITNLDKLDQLFDLKMKGAISNDEYQTLKDEIMRTQQKKD